MEAVGEVQPVGGAHFVERASLLSFLDEMIVAPDLEVALRENSLKRTPYRTQNRCLLYSHTIFDRLP